MLRKPEVTSFWPFMVGSGRSSLGVRELPGYSNCAMNFPARRRTFNALPGTRGLLGLSRTMRNLDQFRPLNTLRVARTYDGATNTVRSDGGMHQQSNGEAQ